MNRQLIPGLLPDFPDIDPHLDPAFDPDVVLITDYLTGELSPDAARAVELRLDSDLAFRDKVMPLIRVWQLPADALLDPVDRAFDELDETLKHERAARDRSPFVTAHHQAAWDSVTRHAGLPRSDARTLRRIDDKRSRWRRVWEWPHWAQAAGIVALIAKLGGLSFAGYALARAVEERALHPASTPANPLPHATDTTGALVPTRAAVAFNDTVRHITLPDSTRLTLAPGATFAWRLMRPDSPIFGWAAQLRGDAELEIVSSSRLLTVFAPTGSAFFMYKGHYSIHVTAEELVVHTQSGRGVQLKGLGHFPRPVMATEGEVGRVRAGADAEKGNK